jgi:hypothetical protein
MRFKSGELRNVKRVQICSKFIQVICYQLADQRWLGKAELLKTIVNHSQNKGLSLEWQSNLVKLSILGIFHGEATDFFFVYHIKKFFFDKNSD